MKRFLITFFIVLIGFQSDVFSQVVSDTKTKRNGVKTLEVNTKKPKKIKDSELRKQRRGVSKDIIRTRALAPSRVLAQIPASFTHYVNNEVLSKLDSTSAISEVEYNGIIITEEALDIGPISASVTDSGKTITYVDLWTSTDFIIKPLSGGKEEIIVLKTNAAPDSFRFQITGGLPLSNYLSYLVPPAAITSDSANVPVSYYATAVDSNGFILVIKPDKRGLLARHYPVTIDPTVVLVGGEYPKSFQQNPGVGQEYHDYLNGHKLSDTLAITISYEQTSDHIKLIYYKFDERGTVTFPADTAYEVVTIGTNSGEPRSTVVDGRYAFIVYHQPNSPWHGRVKVIDMDIPNYGLNTVGNETNVTTTGNMFYFDVKPYKDKKAILFYQDQDSSAYTVARVLTYDPITTDVILGKKYVYEASTSNYIGAVRLGETKYMMGKHGAPENYYIAQLHPANDSLSFGPVFHVSGSHKQHNFEMLAVDSTTVIIPDDGTGGLMSFRILTVSNDSIVAETTEDTVAYLNPISHNWYQQGVHSYSIPDSLLIVEVEQASGVGPVYGLVSWSSDGTFLLVDTVISTTVTTYGMTSVLNGHVLIGLVGGKLDDESYYNMIADPVIIDNGYPLILDITPKDIDVGKFTLEFDTVNLGHTRFDSFYVFDANQAIMSPVLNASQWNDSLLVITYDTLSVDSTGRLIQYYVAGYNADTLRGISLLQELNLLPIIAGRVPSSLFASDQVSTAIKIGAYDISRANQTTGYQIDTTSLGVGGWGSLVDSTSLPYTWSTPTTDKFYFFRVRVRNIYGILNNNPSTTFSGIKGSGGAGSTVTILEDIYTVKIDSITGDWILIKVSDWLEVINDTTDTPVALYVPYYMPLDRLRNFKVSNYTPSVFYRREQNVNEILDLVADGQNIISS